MISQMRASKSKLIHEMEAIAAPLGIILIALFSSPIPGTIRLMGFSMPVLCPFRAFTGFDCPGCGITRALVLAFHGHWKESYLMHIWGIPFAILLIALVFTRAISLLRTVTAKPVPVRTPIFSSTARRWISHFVMLSLLLPWAFKTTALLYILYF